MTLQEQIAAITTEVCNAATNAVAQLANAIPQLQPLWDAITGVINQICAAVGVG